MPGAGLAVGGTNFPLATAVSFLLTNLASSTPVAGDY